MYSLRKYCPVRFSSQLVNLVNSSRRRLTDCASMLVWATSSGRDTWRRLVDCTDCYTTHVRTKQPAKVLGAIGGARTLLWGPVLGNLCPLQTLKATVLVSKKALHNSLEKTYRYSRMRARALSKYSRRPSIVSIRISMWAEPSWRCCFSYST